LAVIFEMSADWRQHQTHGGHDHRPAGHVHAPASFGMAFAVGIGLNLTFVAVEFIYGVLANSVALIADAGHNLSDVLGLVIAWIASALTKRAPSSRYTYGLGGSSILAAVFNAVLLLVAVGAIAWEAVLRLFHPEPVASGTVMIVAAVGIIINGATAWLFASGRKSDLNIRGAFLHMVADAAVSAGVVVAGLLITLHRLVLARPAHQPRDCRRHCMGHLGLVARLAGDVGRRGAGIDRPASGAELSLVLRRRCRGA
jgi:cobalt-zinc-cadmium efflux system protein